MNARMANDLTQSVALTEGVDMEIMDRRRVITNPDHPNSAVMRIR